MGRFDGPDEPDPFRWEPRPVDDDWEDSPHDTKTLLELSLLVPLIQVALHGAELIAADDCPEALRDWLREARIEAEALLKGGYAGNVEDLRASKLAAEAAIKQVI